MSLFGNRQLVDITFEALTALCAKHAKQSKLTRNAEGALSITHVMPDGKQSPGMRVRCDEITEAELPRQHEVWYQPAIVGIAEAGWDEPHAWRAPKAAAAPSSGPAAPTGFEG